MMNTVISLLQRASAAGVHVLLRDGTLQVQVAKGNAVAPALLAELKEQKEAIIAFLQNSGLQAVKIDGSSSIPLADRSANGCLPLSFSQERLLFIDKLEGSVAYHLPAVFTLKGELNTGALQQAFVVVIDRHEALRTVIRQAGSTYCQQILSADGWQMMLATLAGESLSGFLKASIEKPFDLYHDYPVRATLVSQAPDTHVLLVVVHHIAADGWSLGIIMNEVAAAYNALVTNRQALLPPLPVQYADYAAWQRQYLQGDVLEKKLGYWVNHLQGVQPLQLVTDKVRPAVQTFRGQVHRFTIHPPLTQALQQFSRSQGNTLYVTLLAAFNVLMHRYSGQTDICVGTPVAGRQHPEVEGLAGFFTNTLALRLTIDPQTYFTGVLEQVKALTIQAFEHQDVPFEKIVERVVKERDLSRSPLFQVMFGLQNVPRIAGESLNGLHIEAHDAGLATARFDIAMNIREQHETLQVMVEYATDLFEESTIERMAGHYQQILQQVVNHAQQPVGAINLLTQAERQQVLFDFNNTATPLPQVQTIHGLFQLQAQAHPHAIACVCGQQQLTYGQLHQRSGLLAQYLTSQGIGHGSLVPVCIERGIDMLVALLAVLKAGAAFVPVDPAFPAERKAFMVEDAAAALVITSEGAKAQLPAVSGTRLLSIDGDAHLFEDLAAHHEEVPADPEHIAYVIHTSGSTGKPKGVMVAHRSVVNLVLSITHTVGFTQCASFLAITTYSFDICYLELLMPLFAGGKLVIATNEQAGDGYLLKQCIETYQPTHMQATPAGWQLLLNAGWQNNGGLRMLIGGEAVRDDVKDRLCSMGSVWNVYGPTETTIWSAIEPLHRHRRVSIGRPVANTAMYIVNDSNVPVPVGLPGEICIAGVGLAKGYLNRPNLTAERFVPNPFNVPGYPLMYRTGDVGRWLPDGRIEYIDRVDNQVKVRGFRIELGEIENVLLQSGLVLQAVVSVKGEGAAKRLVGYTICATPVKGEDLIAYLKTRLPDYMVPMQWVQMEAFPLTPNGKTDRKSLPDPGAAAAESAPYVAPQTALQQVLAQKWQQLLRIDRVGIHHNFFELGGHSLLAMQLTALLREEEGIQLPLKMLFQQPTIAGLAAHLQQRQASAITAVPRAERPACIPLSFTQERLHFIHQLEGSVPYHLHTMLRLHGALNTDALQQAFAKVVERHEVLRTTYHDSNGQVCQIIHPANGFAFTSRQINREEDIQQVASTFIQQPFNLAADSVLRAMLVQQPGQVHYLVIVLHHIAADGWSVPLLVNEIAVTYNHLVAGAGGALPPLPVQFADVAIWQRNTMEGALFENHLHYWQNKLSGVEALQLLTDYPRPPVQTSRGNVVEAVWQNGLLQQVQGFSRQQGVTSFTTVLAVVKLLLYRYCNQHDITVGTPVANREAAGLQHLVGFFANTLALRTEVQTAHSFIAHLQAVGQTVSEALEHQEVPFEKVIEAVVKNRDLSRSPLFQVMVVWQQRQAAQVPALHGLQAETVGLTRNTAMFDVTFTITEGIDTLHIAAEYRTDLFAPATIQRMVHHFENLLRSAISNPQVPLNALPMLGDEERALVLEGFNSTTVDFKNDKNLAELFEAQVAIHGNAPAVLLNDACITYHQLNQKANRLAHLLQQKGVVPNTVVPVCIERSFDMVVAIVGILKAGGCYMPVDPEYPEDRIAFMLADANAAWVVCSHHTAAMLGRFTGAEQIIAGNNALLNHYPATNPPTVAPAGSLAYVLYTSGSTGRPKGAVMKNDSLVNLLFWQQTQFDGSPRRVLQFSSLNFDVHFLEIFGSLCFGHQVYLIDGDRRKDMHQLRYDLQRYQITHLYFPYIGLKTLAEQFTTSTINDGVLKVMIIAGEQLKLTDDIVAFIRRNHITIHNQYGPTEGHVVSSFNIEPGDAMPALPPIGKPISNTRLYILNSAMHPVPVGVPGELYIGGVPVPPGYLNNPALTAERFISDPFSNQHGALLYKTGDVARWLPDGNIEYLGRLDDQVKIRGNRVELGEVESVLQQSPAVKKVVVVARPDKLGYKQLVCFVVPHGSFEREQLVAYARQRLPDFMVPGIWVAMSDLPVNKSGKVDRRALPAVDMSAALATGFVAPRNQVEQQLAAIWQQLLGLQRVGVHDNFFEVGGHSLLATRVIAAVRARLHVELSIRDVFQHATIAALAGKVSQLQPNAQSFVLLQRPQRLPPAFTQERIWFIHRMQGSVQYHLPCIIRLQGQVQPARLQQAFADVVQRHEALRTVMIEEEGRPYQHIMDAAGWQLHMVDITDIQGDEKQVLALADRIVAQPFDLARDYMLRCHLLHHSGPTAVLVITLHHIAADGWSVPILARELAECYNNRAANLQPLAAQYADVALWQQKLLHDGVLDADLQYWKKQLAGVQPLELATDKPRPAIQSSRGAVLQFVIPAWLATNLQQQSQAAGCTRFMTLLAAFKTLLWRYSGQHDICVGTPIANRTQQEFEPLIGSFINLLALRSNIDPATSFSQLLQQVKHTTLEAYHHQQVPFEKVIDQVGALRDTSRSPLFQAMFVWQNFEDTPPLQLDGLQVEWLPLTHTSAKYDLTLFAKQHGEVIHCTLEYCTDLFEAATMERFTGHFNSLLQAVTHAPHALLGNIELATGQQKEWLLQKGAGTITSVEPANVVSLFEQAVARKGDAVAVVYQHLEASFNQLNCRANQLADRLKAYGVQPGWLIPLMVPAGIDMVAGMLGILKTGAAYVPIDPALPPGRLAFIFKDIAARMVVTLQAKATALPPGLVTGVVLMDDAAGETAPGNHHVQIQATDLAYVIYTSGSTGTPKGVPITHGNLVNYLLNHDTQYVGGDAGTFATFSHLSYTFDASVTSLLMPLVHGRPLVLAHSQSANVFDDANLLKYAPYDFIKLTPAHLPLLALALEKANHVKIAETLVLGGEALTPAQLQYFGRHLPGITIVNEYGPTEATVGCTVYSCKAGEIDTSQASLSIGKPISNTTIYITSPQGQLQPVGVPGEICIGGKGLALGYLNRPELTNEKFVDNPFAAGQKLYRTSDLGRWTADGNIAYLGRIDEQVKVRGYRIEPGEIESVVQQSGLVSQCAVLALANTQGNKYLCAFVVPQHKEDYNQQQLTDYLSQRLPDYMVPQSWVLLEQLPLTPNGKTDRRQLALMAPEQQATAGYQPPTTQTEADLATIWAQLLGREQVGIHDNFFELGGDSILTIQAVSRAGKLGHRLQPRDIFVHQTIYKLAQVLQQQSSQQATGEQGVLSGEAGLLPIQQWYLGHATEETISHYNQSVLLQINREVTPAALQQATHQLLHHHDALRFAYSKDDEGQWHQHYTQATTQVYVEDLSQIATDQLANEIHDTANRYQQSLDITKGDLVRVVLITTPSADDHNRLLIIIHHLAVDGVSWRILLEDMEALLAVHLTQTPMALPAKTTSYRQWQQLLTQYATSPQLQQQQSYWQQQHLQASQLQLPTDRQYTGTITAADLGYYHQSLDAAPTQQLLQQVPKVYHTEINDLLLAALAKAMYQQFGQQQVAIGLEGHGRQQDMVEAVLEEGAAGIDLGRTVGWFTTLYPVVLSTAGTGNPDQLIKTIKEQLRKVPGKGLGYGVLKYLQRHDHLQGSDPWQVVFNYLGQLDNVVNQSQWLQVAAESSGNVQSAAAPVREKLSVIAFVANGQLLTRWIYSTHHFNEASVANIAHVFIQTLAGFTQLALEQQTGGHTIFTPSDFGLGDEVSVDELDSFLNNNSDELFSF